MNATLETEADALAEAFVLAHDGDALDAHNHARAIARFARQRNDEPTARIHTLAAETISARHPNHFTV